MPNSYESGQSGQGYIAQGLGGLSQGLAEGVKMGHDIESTDLMRRLIYDRAKSLDEYRNGNGGLLDLKAQANDIAQQRADAASAKADKTAAASRKNDEAKADIDAAAKAGTYSPDAMPWVINFRRASGRMPTDQEMAAQMAKMHPTAAGGGVVAPVAQPGVLDKLKAMVGFGGGAPAAGAPAAAAPAPAGGFDWKSVPAPR